MVEVTHCPICSSNDFSVRFTDCKDHTVSQETFTVIECRHCRFLVTSPRPADTNLGKYYASTAYISHSAKARTLFDKLYFLARRLSLKWKLRLLTRFKKTPGALLDYGCGTGEFLKTCHDHGWAIAGIEPSTAARTLASELNKTGRIHESLADLGGKHFDVITLWHVLEHVPDPHKTIQDLADLLGKNGMLFIAVPNHNAYDSTYYKKHWAGYDVPRHLWHFGKQNMVDLLHAHSLTLIDITPMGLDSFYVSMLSEKYLHSNTSSLTGWIRAIWVGFLSNFKALRSGEYSSLIYIAMKK